MTFMQINWMAGETIDGSVGAPGIFTSKLRNLFLNDQKHPILRAANDFNASYESPGHDTYIRSIDSMVRNWVVSAMLVTSTSCRIVVFDTTTFTTYGKIITSAKTIKSVFFNEASADTLTAVNGTTKINTVVGETAILICGLDKMYYIDSDFAQSTPAIKEFKIKTSITVAGESIVDSIDSTNYQSRIAIVCASPHLTIKLPNYSTKRILISRTYSIDDFTIATSSTEQTDIDQNPADFIILCPANEQFYAISTDENLLILVTSLGLRVIKSGDETSGYMKNSNLIQYKGGYGRTIRARAIPFGGFLIFATTYTLQAKMLESLETNYVNTIDLILPLLSELPSKIRDVDIDNNMKNLMIFLENGQIANVTSQSTVPSHSYNLTLPVALSYVSDNIEFLYVSSMNPSWMLLRSYDDADVEYYTVVSRDYDNNYHGFLLDGAQEFYWQVTPSNITADSFTATFATRFLETANIIGLWLRDGMTWRFYATDVASYPKFTTQVPGHSLVEGQKYECILAALSNAYQVFPGAYAQTWAIAEININVVGDSDQINYQINEFHDAPINEFFDLNNIPTTQTYQGEMILHIALSAPEMSIGWRDIGCVDNLYNRGGIRCVMLSDSNDITNYVDFYNDNSSVAIQINEDCTEIEFQTNLGISYTQKTINASAKRFLSAERDKKFTRLIGQY